MASKELECKTQDFVKKGDLIDLIYESSRSTLAAVPRETETAP